VLRAGTILACLAFLVPAHEAQASLFGEENVPLFKLVLGQIVELERLGAMLQIAKEQRELMEQVNAGVHRTLQQIEAIEEILRRAQGLDPRNIRRISDLNEAVHEVKELKRRAQEVLTARLAITDHAVSQSGLQAETAYTMGQEMIRVGSDLSRESAQASPGRASQISAAAQTSQTISNGVVLQTLAHIAQLQAMGLELQKAEIEHRLVEAQSQSEFYRTQLAVKERK
jgi:hypothetical protein